ncbi:hypothetical protein AMK05_PE00076 (plasmid) [Rhizobium sp. N324]|nr:hypothetical protein AMK05_PE00076 [Rhizobium sp. N324]OYC99549.1 hypothetical protein AMK08_PE00076 [Rhizobium sp. N4311]
MVKIDAITLREHCIGIYGLIPPLPELTPQCSSGRFYRDVVWRRLAPSCG